MTQQFDDLTRIKGIGTATAAHLVKAGISTFALLAASSVEALGKVGGLSATKAPEWPAWIEEAGKLAATSPNQGNGPEPGGVTGISTPGVAPDKPDNAAGNSQTGPTNTTPSESPKGGGGNPAPAAGARFSVCGPERGRWRAGLHFTPEARTIEVVRADAPEEESAGIVQVSEMVFERIKADPTLSVRPA